MIPAPAFLTNPERFMAFSRWAAPLLGVTALALAAAGLWLGFTAPEDYQQGDTVRIMFIHVPAAWMSLFVYLCLGGASLLSLVFRHALADAAAQAAAPLGAGFTLLALVTGSLWGKPMWGAWWVWDARLTSVLVLFLFYLAYIALRASLDDEAKAARAGAILALVGLVNLPIVHWSVTWWNSLHQGSSVFRPEGPSMPPVYLAPLLLMGLAYMAAFGSLWLVRIRGEVWRRRAEAAALRAARA
ncbi:MAG: heme ABC transporter permease CcmC [Phenylobacterium sp.]